MKSSHDNHKSGQRSIKQPTSRLPAGVDSRRVISLWLILFLACQPGWAASSVNDLGSTLTTPDQIGATHSSEYISGTYPGAILMRVQLWGAVGLPGVHLIPTQTDLFTFLSFAGGPAPQAELESILIKRTAGTKEEIIHVDGSHILDHAGVKIPELKENDIIVVPTVKPLINPDTLTVISVIGSLLSIVTVGLVLTQNR